MVQLPAWVQVIVWAVALVAAFYQYGREREHGE